MAHTQSRLKAFWSTSPKTTRWLATSQTSINLKKKNQISPKSPKTRSLQLSWDLLWESCIEALERAFTIMQFLGGRRPTKAAMAGIQSMTTPEVHVLAKRMVARMPTNGGGDGQMFWPIYALLSLWAMQHRQWHVFSYGWRQTSMAGRHRDGITDGTIM